MGRRKHKYANKNSICSVCYESGLSSTFSIPCSSSHLVFPQETICNSCLYQYIISTILQDITNQVVCPQHGCNTKLRNDTIEAALTACNRRDLWEEYILKSSWHGTSEEWIKRFSARCPGCLVPIEKNGGCNQVVCRQCQLVFDWQRAKNSNLNLYGGTPFGGGFPPQFPGSFPQQGFGQYGSGGGYFNGSVPFQGGNVFPGGSPFPPPPPPASGFLSPPIGGQFGQGFGFPSGSGGFGYPPSPYGSAFPPGQQLPYGSPFSPGQQPPFAPPFSPGQQTPYGAPNYFGSGFYGQPRSRHSSRHRSQSRRHHRTTSSSSSDDEPYNRGSPFGRRGNPYANVQPFPNMPPVSPRGGSPFIPPRGPAW